MTNKTIFLNFFLGSIIGLSCFQIRAQEIEPLIAQDSDIQATNTWNRSRNVIMLGAGSTLVNGDLNAPEYENFFQLQYKRFIHQNLNISGNLKKFDIENYDFDTNGFLSGDINLEWYVLPTNRFSPYLFLGIGILTSNDFKDQNYKAQGGIGVEFLITNCLAVSASAEANYIYDAQKGSQLLQEADNAYYNALIGVHIYFGDQQVSKKKKREGKASVIDSNLIH